MNELSKYITPWETILVLACEILPFAIGAAAIRLVDAMSEAPAWAQMAVWFLLWFISTKFVSHFGKLVARYLGRFAGNEVV